MEDYAPEMNALYWRHTVRKKDGEKYLIITPYVYNNTKTVTTLPDSPIGMVKYSRYGDGTTETFTKGQLNKLAELGIDTFRKFVIAVYANPKMMRETLAVSGRCGNEWSTVLSVVRTIRRDNKAYFESGYVAPKMLTFPPISSVQIKSDLNVDMDEISKEVAAKIPEMIQEYLSQNLGPLIAQASQKVYQEKLAAAEAEKTRIEKEMEKIQAALQAAQL